MIELREDDEPFAILAVHSVTRARGLSEHSTGATSVMAPPGVVTICALNRYVETASSSEISGMKRWYRPHS